MTNPNFHRLRFKTKHILALMAVGTLLVTSFQPEASAQSGAISPTIGVSPAKIFEAVKPGQTAEYQIKLRNLGSDPIPLSASTTNVSSVSDSGIPVFSASPGTRSAESWIELKSTDVIVGSGEQAQITISVTPPADAAPGGYTAAVVFQAQLPSYYFDIDASARVLPAISVLLFLTIPTDGLPNIDDVRIEEISVPKLVVSTPISVVAGVNNPTNFFVQTDANVSIKGAFSKRTEEESLGTVVLLPEGKRRFVSAFTGNFWPGLYTASVSLKQGEKVLVSSAKFVALPWPFITALIVLGLGTLVVAGRKRFKKAWAVLRGKDIKPSRRYPTLR